MLISYRWLGRHVDLGGISPERVAEDLTLSVAEVEGIEPFAPCLSDVVVGHVVKREAHPDADKLAVCTVDVGAEEPLNIVCGAPNVREGLHVAVARVGTVLPGEFKIKKSKIRGVLSVGMICSERELGLGDEHDGIWELPGAFAPGLPVAGALGVEDWVIEIDNKSITHRPDLWGHRGIARELAGMLGRELLPLDTSLPAVGQGTPVSVRVEDAACSRYLALAVDGVRVEKSPLWLKLLLLAAGQRPIDLTVDLSNFVMLDLAQPNHLFDRAQVSEGIVVRKARRGERIETLDGIERELIETDLLICGGDKPVALAGIMGGAGSKVAEGTSSLLLEVATFDPTVVRRTSSRLGLRTDSSARFEKSLDPTLPLKAAGHFVRLLQSIQPEVSLPAPLSDAGEWQDPAGEVALRPERVRAVLGAPVSDEDIMRHLTSIGFGVAPGAGGTMTVSVPSARATKDIQIEADLIEEVGRLVRYANIPVAKLVAPLEPPAVDPRRLLVRRLQDELAGGARFRELVSYSFVSDELLELLGTAGQPRVSVVNPVAAGVARIRRCVMPSLLESLRSNVRHRETLRLFEVGKGYLPEHANEAGEPAEVHRLAALLAQPKLGKRARFDAGALPQLMAATLELLRAAGIADPEFASVETEGAPGPEAWCHPGETLAVRAKGRDGQPAWLGVIASLEPGLARRLDLIEERTRDVAGLVLCIDGLLEAAEAGSSYRPIPRFPGIKVDVAVEMPDTEPAARTLAAIEKAGKGLVTDVEPFDLYRGPNIKEDAKSLAFHVLLQSPNKTLSDGDGAKFLGRLERLVQEFSGRLRKD